MMVRENNRSKAVSPCRFIIKSQEHTAQNRQEAAAIILNIVAEQDESILDRVAGLREHGVYRRYLAKSADEVYPENPKFAAKKTFQFRPGWYIPGGLGPKTLSRLVKMVCKSSNFEYGKDIILLDQ